MEAKGPSPQTTLLILLGASEWPLSPEFQSSEAFANAARELKDYFRDPQQFGLPPENVLDLFNSPKSPDELDEEIAQFLDRRIAALKASGNAAKDIVIYFVGHGGFVGHDSDFYLAIHRTRTESLRASGIQMMALADTITEKARHLRRIMILDCCFAAAAFRAFQADPAQIALAKTVNAFEVKQKGTGFPGKGVALLCSSDQKTPSLLLPDGTCTMFSKALLDALSKGSAGKKDQLSLRDVKDIAADILHDMPTRNAPRPVVHSPDQSEGDVADVPFFPNPAVKIVETSQGSEVLLTQEEDDKDREGAEEHGSQPRKPPQVLTSFPQRRGLSIGIIIGVVVLVLILISGAVFALVTYIAPARPAHLRPTTAQASATTKAAATATGIANQNPYSPFEGTLKLNDPLIDNNKGYHWDIGSFAGGSCEFIGGDYHVVASQYGRFFGCIARTLTFTDFAFQVQMIVTKGNSGGILFRRAGDPSAFYIFTIGTDGSYKLMFFDGKNPTILRQGSSPYINTGLKQPNVIAVVMRGSTFSLYTNLYLLESTSHSTLRSGGIGFVATDIADVAFRDAKVWTL